MSRPDLIVISKGEHEATIGLRNGTERSDPVLMASHPAFTNQWSAFVQQWEAQTRVRLRAFGNLLRACKLPPTSAVIWRTSELAVRYPTEAPLMALYTQRTIRRAVDEEQIFGSDTLLVDAFALTRVANASGSALAVSIDGHHSPSAVQEAEWQLIYMAFTLLQDLRGSNTE